MTVSSNFSDLSWHDLHQWAGETIVTRGKNYQSRVSDLRLFSDRYLLAWVRGREDYETVVWIDDSGALERLCSCPYWGPCKHSVAALLVYNEILRSGKSVTEAKASDSRLELLHGYLEGLAPDIKVSEAMGARDKMASALAALDSTELVALLLEVAQRDVEIQEFMELRLMPADEDLQPVIDQLQRDIKATVQQQGRRNHWGSEDHTPDYSSIEERLSLLVCRGCYEPVIELGELLLEQGIEHIENSQDQGETQIAIAGCFAEVFQAVAASGRSAAERMLWYWDLQLEDDYCLLEDVGVVPVDEQALMIDDWVEVAHYYEAQLQTAPRSQKGEQDWSARYRRSKLLKNVQRAWSAAQEPEQVTRILTVELPYGECYLELVDHLLAQGATEEAKAWSCRGIRETQNGSPGIAQGLRERLPKIAEKAGDVALAAAHRVASFVDSPTVMVWNQVKLVADKAGHWPAVRNALLQWLESGNHPAQQNGWPLPDPGLPVRVTQRGGGWQRPDHFPGYAELIAIALHEQRIEDAVGWYQQQPQPRSHSHALADAATICCPALSLQIWQQHIVKLIAEVKPRAYREAKPFLRKIQALMSATGHSAEFGVFITKLRLEHRAKRRLIEVLDEVEHHTLDKKLSDG